MTPRPPLPAATVLVLHDRPLQVLMIRRPPGGMFGGVWVFPGGVVDGDDGPHGDDEGDGPALRAAAVRELAEETGVQVPTGSLRFVSRWLTPEGMPRRYDTRFYLTVLPGAPPDITPHSPEVAEAEFVGPATALAAHQAHHWKMVLPTLAHLRWLSRFQSGTEAFLAAQHAETRPISPRVREDGSVVAVDLPK